MKNRLCKSISGLKAEQAGQALVLILIFFLLGSLTITPVLMHMATALKTQAKYEDKTNEFFTADAGIETGLWRIKYDFMGPDYDPFDFETVWPYETDEVNGLSADVLVQNVWLPSNITLGDLMLDAEEAREIIESEKLVITGTSASSSDPFYIKMEYEPDAGDNLTVKSIGVWLPQGFNYDEGSSDLEQLSAFHPCHTVASISYPPGGTAIVWSYNAPYPLFTSFPNYSLEGNIMTVSFSFSYDPPAGEPDQTPRAVAWVLTEMEPACVNTNNTPISWDSDIRYYKITSASGTTNIEAYQSKALLRNLDAAIAGDYVAIGNSLMTGGSYPDYRKTTLLSSSSTDVSAVSPIPADADVIAAYLYWTAFRDSTGISIDNCSSFNGWDRDSNQTRIPIGDNSSTGTWNTAPYWDDVDETTFNDTDYITGTASPATLLFNFNPFTIPAGTTITDLTIYYRARDVGSADSNRIYASLMVDGARYDAGYINPGTDWATYSYSFTDNPATSDPWTADDINGIGSDPLQNFGLYSSDLDPDIDISMVYAEVNTSRWATYTSYSGTEFRGRGSADVTAEPRYLTMKNSLDLSSYASGSVYIGWEQSESGYLESDDILYCSVSNDGGLTWSDNIKVFSDDSPAARGAYHIKDEYICSSFKIRFYFNFNSTEEYVYLDNIGLYSMSADTAASFSIDGQQVYLDSNGDPQEGEDDLIASYWATLPATGGTGIASHFYACYRDVSKLVKTYPVDEGEEHHTGNAVYTVGGVYGVTGQYVSNAGWSLIIVYGSPGTAGHYLYLWDIHDLFTCCPQNGYLDFDGDGEPGGDISGFTFPEPIRDKYGVVTDDVSAKLTCFVTEGDTYTGDHLKITGEQSQNYRYLYNTGTDPEDNVWNSQSIGMSVSGIDVDTFLVYWTETDNIFTPGDTSVNLYMDTEQDVWNLIFIIMSVRSETDTRGTGHYTITPD